MATRIPGAAGLRTHGSIRVDGQGQRLELVDNFIGRRLAHFDCGNRAVELGAADVSKIGTDQHVVRAHGFQNLVRALLHQQGNHLQGYRKRRAEVLFGQQRLADVDDNDYIDTHCLDDINRERC